MAIAVEHLVAGETMQISTSREQRRRLTISCYTVITVTWIHANILQGACFNWRWCIRVVIVLFD